MMEEPKNMMITFKGPQRYTAGNTKPTSFDGQCGKVLCEIRKGKKQRDRLKQDE